MAIDIRPQVKDLEAAITQLSEENINLRIQLAAALRVIKELDLSTPEGASKLVGVVPYEGGGDDDELPVVSNEG